MNLTRNQRLLWTVGTVFVVGYALVPFLWIASLSLKTEGTLTDGNFFPRDITLENYTGIFSGDQFPAALRNSIGISLIATLIAITLATTTAYAIARLEFPGKTLVLGAALAIAMFPPISVVGPLFSLWRGIGLVRHLAGADHPLHDLHLAAGHLRADGVLPRDPLGPGIAFFTGESQFTQPTGQIAAAAVVVTVPIIVMVQGFQRRIVAGLTSGAVKG